MTSVPDRLLTALIDGLHHSGLCRSVLLLPGFERLRWAIGRAGVRARFAQARRRVPAYATVVNERADAGIPMTDKRSYVQRFAIGQRCMDGVIPAHGVLFDESSGSSGRPTSWVRGTAERRANARTIRMGLSRRLVGSRPLLFINAFALGPWATGINLTMALSTMGHLKALGPDIDKIAHTIREFGETHHLVVMGYPPFLRQLLDRAGVNWHAFQVSFIYGGEGMSESMRALFQQRGVARVYGSYGASDLELNIAAETDYTIALRRLLQARPEIARDLVKQQGALPMLFQYNPAEFFLETTPDGQLLVTICRPGYLAPKIRYNIQDLGHVVRHAEIARVLTAHGVDITQLAPEVLDLPVLFLYGRADQSVSWYGCKIPPTDVQDAICRTPQLASRVDGFQLGTTEDATGDKRLVIAVEETSAPHDAWSAADDEVLLQALATVNQDFRESLRLAPADRTPEVHAYAAGAGPFANRDVRIKRQYVAS
ncbi:phenylacetate--CoA ligase family protein [Gemmatimonas phototrophica]|uniref:phenylacetate--CoA ligase family protein n=1 Tax=Gemmatimonas phototrophica TaxID=1379270 RepID=UPI0011AE672C|nr:CoF synthetase [Gemmatimonas phototrophica]